MALELSFEGHKEFECVAMGFFFLNPGDFFFKKKAQPKKACHPVAGEHGVSVGQGEEAGEI